MTDKVDEIAKELGVTLNGPKIDAAFVAAMIEKEEYFHFPESTHTICVLTLYNGFRVTGESACASLENFNDEIGRRFAKENAVSHLWPFAGFWLRQKLWQSRGLYDPKTVEFWIGALPGPEDPQEINPAVAHIDAARDSHVMETAVGDDKAGVQAALTVATQQLADAGLLQTDEADKRKAGLASAVLSEGS